MARDRRSRDQIRKLRLDLSELDINTTLLEDLRFYVGSPSNYVPKIFAECINVLKETNRLILIENDHEDVLDDLWDKFRDGFSEKRFRDIVKRHGISIRMADYGDRVADFYMDIFELTYTQICKYLDTRLKGAIDAEFTDFQCEVIDVLYYENYDGFSDVKIETAAVCLVTKVNHLSTKSLLGKGYDY